MPTSQKRLSLSVALVCDFYLPSLGGVQMHIHQLAIRISQKIQNLIIITHQYPDHIGLKYENGFKIYYLPIAYDQRLNVIYPTFFLNFYKAKQILAQQKVQIVHCHQTGSSLSLEFGLYAKILGLKTIHTQHSLYGFKSLFDIHFNKLLPHIINHYDKVICVSRTTRNNMILRAKIQPFKTIVIPNAVSISQQILNKHKQFRKGNDKHKICVIFVGRLVYRRGLDLLIQLLPEFCKRNPKIQIKIVGDGPKRAPLQAVIRQNKLGDQVKTLGARSNSEVLQLMSSCQIFINTPITQSFGIALVQAASLGLLCVSTDVGGIKQTLPQQMLIAVQPKKNNLIQGLQLAIKRLQRPQENNQSGIKKIRQDIKIQNFYSWRNISNRTLEVYLQVGSFQKQSKKNILKKVISHRQILTIFVLIYFLAMFLFNKLIQTSEKIFKNINSNKKAQSQNSRVLQQFSQQKEKTF